MILKYILLALTNILAFAGAWVFAFTETDKQSGRKKLTKWGKIALPVAFLLLIAGFSLTIYDDAESRRKADIASQAAEKKEKELQTKIDQLTADVSRSADNTDAIKELVVLLAQPPSDKRNQDIAELISSPDIENLASISPEFKATLGSLESQLGGRSAYLNRLRAKGVTLPENDESVLSVASIDLRLFGDRRMAENEARLEETSQAVLSLIRGLDADIIVVQEVADLAHFQTILNEVPQYFAAFGQGDVRIFQAVLFKRDRVQLRRPPLSLDRTDEEGRRLFARSPIAFSLVAGKSRFGMLSFHLKSQFGDDRGVSRRTAELKAIADWLSRGDGRSIMLAGRTQVGLDAPEMDLLFQEGVEFGTADLPEGSSTLVSKRWGSIVMSHIGGVGEIKEMMIKGSTELVSLETLMSDLTLEEIQKRITDHNPIMTAFVVDR